MYYLHHHRQEDAGALITFAWRDLTNNEWYFIDPYGMYEPPACYLTKLTDPINTACVRYSISWKGSKPQYP